MGVLSGLEPREVFDYFEQLCAVPHGSGNTAAASDLCVAFAQAHGLRCRREACGNVVIWKKASPGCEGAAPVILQGHLDMVCAKTDDCPKDMAKEGLDLRTDGTWVWADKTSLGGDDGIAVAMILAILADDTLVHPPLEAVFTVEEETGMDGAAALDVSDLKGRKLLNLDSEIEGVFTVSCAGGMRSDCLLPAAMTAATGMTGFTLTCERSAVSAAVDAERTAALLRALAAMPHGVAAMDTDFPGLVQTSLNMGVVCLSEDGLHITFSIRSSLTSRKEMLARRVRAVAALAGGAVTERGRYPGWQYRRESAFRDTVVAAYEKVTGREAVVEATHGGLECGLLIEKLPGLDAVSLGPDIPDIHSVRERLGVASTARVYAAVREALRCCAVS